MGYVAGSYEKPVAAYVANGSTNSFTFRFVFLQESDVTVHVNGVALAPTQYTLTGEANNNGGTVVLKTMPANGDVVNIMRETPFVRGNMHYQDNGDLIAGELNSDFDRIWLAMQEQQTVSDDTMIRPAIANAAWDGKGSQIRDIKDGTADTDAATVGQVKTLNGGAYASMQAAQASQAAAAASQSAAAGSASQSAASAANAAQSAAQAANSASAAAQSVSDAANEADRAKTEADRAAGEAVTATTQANTATTSQGVASQQAQLATDQAAIATREAAKLGNMNNLAAAIKQVIGDHVEFNGQLTVGFEGTQDSDVATMRQLRAATASTGQNAALINGVMNNFLGAVQWWNGTRTTMPKGYLPTDGQLLNRVDYPELWAAVEAGIFNAVSDADWLKATDANGYNNCASFSTGNGTSTFRLPDLNGGQTNAISNLFLRGSSPGNANIGKAQLDGAPNISGAFWGVSWTNKIAEASGSFHVDRLDEGQDIGTLPVSGDKADKVQFDASRSYNGYGRSPTEIRPRAAIGVWIIRVNGSFTAANTNFHVITGDAAEPAAGTAHYGGELISNYQVAGANKYSAVFRAYGSYGNFAGAQIVASDGEGKIFNWDFDAKNKTFSAATGKIITGDVRVIGGPVRFSNAAQTGELNIGINSSNKAEVVINRSAGVTSWNWNGTNIYNNGGNFQHNGSSFVVKNAVVQFQEGSDLERTHALTNGNQGGETNTSGGAFRSSIRNPNYGAIRCAVGLYANIDPANHRRAMLYVNHDNDQAYASFVFDQSGQGFAPGGWQTGSDIRLKTNIQRIDKPLEKMRQLRGCTWDRLDKAGPGLGFIAQEVQAVFPQAVSVNTLETKLNDGTKLTNTLALDPGAVAAALHHEAILALMDQIEELKAEVAALRN